ncbi:caspase family protein [Mesorhizobium sp. WSM4312]|uniref:caspase family protein n=1 Tax=Mesorhizobium sp. WSM4312 TaxID=2029411 RepID=UPI00117E91A3|nr:caspase family protein [Mesorhizobium sp. WSM4312]
MPDFKPIRKAMVVIAVSNYDPPYEALPGTLTSARRIAAWARTPGDGRNYKVLEITDAPAGGKPGIPVTVERLRKEITDLLDAAIIDRLVVYFAGHGVVRSTAEEFWLLTHAGRDSGECVGVMQFMEGLRNYGIGASSHELKKGQLAIIADACRNVHQDGLGFVANGVMTKKGKAVGLQTDLFRATTLGAYAYQVKAVEGAEPYCLFSSVLCDALEGKVPAVIDSEYHPFKPVISNDKLADYLDLEVPRRAAELNETMEPDNQASIRLDHNYYDILNPIAAIPIGQKTHADQITPPAAKVAEMVQGLVASLQLSVEPFSRPDNATLKKMLERILRKAAATLPGEIDLPGYVSMRDTDEFRPFPFPDDSDWEAAIDQVLQTFSPPSSGSEQQHPSEIDGSKALKPKPSAGARVVRMQFEPEPEAAAGFQQSLKRANLLADSSTDMQKPFRTRHVFFDGDGPIAVPKVRVGSLSSTRFGWGYLAPWAARDLPVFVHQGQGWTLAPSLQRTTSVLLEELPGDVMLRPRGYRDWDVSLSSGAQMYPWSVSRVSDARKLGDEARLLKERRPNDGIRAGYLYRFGGDDDNIVRTANYMAGYGLPFDLAALAATSMTWLQRKGRWQVIADLPAVEDDDDKSRPLYARKAFAARKSVPVWGLFPIHRQGWQLLADADHLDVPQVLRDVASELVGAAAVVLRQAELERLADHFGYVIVEPPKP